MKKEKILIIESDQTFGDQCLDALKKDGYGSSMLVKSGIEGLKAIYEILPHLVLISIDLPGVDGYEILAKKSAEPILAKIPVFLMSTQGAPINMRNIPAGSVTEFIMTIHADPMEIVNKVNKLFGHESNSTAPIIPEDDSNKKKLLWVEDDRLIGTILSNKLISSGFNLFHAKNGEDALEILKTTKPDAIVVDLILPGMSGFEILQKIAMDQGMKDVPKMVLSNLSKPSDIEKAKMLGAKKFLVKAATSLDQIVAEVKELCN